MKRLVSKTLLFALMLAVVFTMMPNNMQIAYADSGEPAMVKGSSVLAKNVNEDGLQRVWFGRYLDPATRKRMWYVIGYNGQGSNPASREGLITILHKNIPPFSGGERFSGNSNVSYANQYSVANIRWIVNSYYNGDGDWKWNNSKEKGIIVKRTLEGGGSNFGEKGYDENKIKGNSVEDAGFWLLSCGEAEALPGGIRHLYNDNTWWLRSPGQYDGKAAYCWTDYNYSYTVVIRDGVSTDTYHGVRPACDLDMNAIMFTSAAEGGKASGSGADALTKVGNNKNSEWKLTIKDASRDAFDITTCEGSYDSESGSVTFRYSGAKVESNSYISAIILGSDESIKYYGRIAEASEASGQVTINTSGKMDDGDRLCVFNEQYNGDKTTDYASDLKEIVLPTTGEHEWTEATCLNPETCEICGRIRHEALGHVYQTVENTAKDPGCTESGKEADQKCSRCGDVVEGAEIPALGHTWGDSRSWTSGGAIHIIYTCSKCGDESEELIIDSSHTHDYDHMGYTDGTKPTCTSNGIKKHYECSCGYWFEVGPDGRPCGEPKINSDFVIPATGHKWKEATCEQPKTCTVEGCGETEGSPLGHDRMFTGWNWVGNEEKGYTEAVASYKCIREGCGDVRQLRITPTARVISPTCTKSGKTEYKAQINSIYAPDLTSRSSQKEAKFTDPLGHDYQEVEDNAVAATCTEPGKEADQKCSRCGDVIDGTVIPALGHDWGEWEPDEETEGVEFRICKNDPSHKEERRIIPAGHQHNLGYIEPKAATCTEAGNIAYYICNSGSEPCGRYFADENGDTEIDKESTVIYPTGHIAGQPVRDNEIAATCTANGEFDEIVSCAECGTEIRNTHRATPALGHTPGEPEIEDYTPANCTQDGKYVEIIHCTICSEEIEHAIVTEPALGHDWGEWITTKLATDKENGERSRVCSRCQETETQVIPKSQSKISIKGAKVVLSKAAFTYNGKVRKPSIKTIGSKTLKAGRDYTLRWSNPSPKNVGKYTVTITGKGKYAGTTKATFRINPKGTSIARLKKAKKAVTVKWKKQSAKMSKSRIKGYQIQLATNKKFTKNRKLVTVKSYKKVSKKVKKLKSKKKYYVRIRTYMTVGGVKYYSPWSKIKTVRTR